MSGFYIIKDERNSTPDPCLPISKPTIGRDRAMIIRKPPLCHIDSQPMICDTELYTSVVSLQDGLNALREQITVLQSGWNEMNRKLAEHLQIVFRDLKALNQNCVPEHQIESDSSQLRCTSRLLFPLNTVDDVKLFDERLSDRRFRLRVKAELEQCYQPDLSRWVRTILRHCIGAPLARQTNMCGKFGKFAFQYTKFYRLIFAITLPSKPSEDNEKMVHTAISSWYRSAYLHRKKLSHVGRQPLRTIL